MRLTSRELNILVYNPNQKERYGIWKALKRKSVQNERSSRPASSPPAAPVILGELKTTQDMLYEFCELFCDHTVDCSESPCNVTISRLHERLEGIMKQMKEHPEYLEKWNVKRAEQESLRKGGER